MAFCSNCGAPLSDGARFCSACGQVVAAAEELPQAKPAAASDMVMHDVVAPAATGEVVLSTWQGVRPQQEEELQPVQGGRATSGSRKGAGSKTKDKKKKSLAPRIVGAVVGLAAVVFIALYVVPLFIVHPHDPNEGKTYTPPASQSETGASVATSSTGTNSSTPSSVSATPSGSTSASVSASSSAQPAASAQGNAGTQGTATPQTSTPKSYSTYDTPTLEDFLWLTGEAAKGNVPSGATRILELGSLTGGWKAYMFGGNMERLLNANIDVGQSEVSIMLDWFYVHDGETDKGFEDTTPNTTFSGAFDGGMLDAVGPGRVTLAAFWEQDGHQYAVGSFMWPDGEVHTIALVRP